MIYRAYLNGALFFDTSLDYENYTLVSAEIELEAGASGSFEFEVPPQNLAYGAFNKRIDRIIVTRDDSEIFYGRVYSVKGEMNAVHTVTCEGYLTALNDSVFPPGTYECSFGELVAAIVKNHNEQVPDYPLTVGWIDEVDDYLYRDYEVYEKSMERLNDLVDSYGGYFSVRHEDGTAYLDYYEEYTDESSQEIDFGENLIDITQESTAEDIITALIPIGATITETTTETDDDGNETETTTKYTVDITSVNDDLNYIIDEDAVSVFGYIWGNYTWDDVEEPANLLKKAKEYLEKQAKQKVTIDVKAVDLADIGEASEHFEIGKYVHVTSSPHGIDENFLCTELSFNLLDPSKDRLKLGDTVDGYIATASKSLSSSVKVVENAISNYASTASAELAAVKEKVITNTTLIEQNSEAITANAESIEELGESVSTLSTTVEETAEGINTRISAVEEDVSEVQEDVMELTETASGLSLKISSAYQQTEVYYCLWSSPTSPPPAVDAGDTTAYVGEALTNYNTTNSSIEYSWSTTYPGINDSLYIWYSLAFTTVDGSVSYTDPALFTGDSVARTKSLEVEATAEELSVKVESMEQSVETLEIEVGAADVVSLMQKWAEDEAENTALYNSLIPEEMSSGTVYYLATAATATPDGPESNDEWSVELPDAEEGWYIWYSILADGEYTNPELYVSEMTELSEAYDALYEEDGFYAAVTEAASATIGILDDDELNELNETYTECYEAYLSAITVFNTAADNTQSALAEIKASLELSNESSSIKTDYNSLISDLQEIYDAFENEYNMHFQFDDSGFAIRAYEYDEDGDAVYYDCSVLIKSNGMYLMFDDQPAAYMAMDEDTGTSYFSITHAKIESTLTLGDFAFIPREDGSMSLTWQGE